MRDIDFKIAEQEVLENIQNNYILALYEVRHRVSYALRKIAKM